MSRLHRYRPGQLGYWGWGLLLVPVLTDFVLRRFVAVGLPESWLASLAALRWVWLLTCIGLILADLIYNRKSYRAAA
ncbi:hypothetical protein [Deinococcus sp. QL22]|uniref:hypothetical protein n=1 Tax=Deinococcus sp. QL22 TaxID=2939437 RepID=UPI002017A8BA|nr:hypothetical protein [Deinococcus sp. QL22]UQN07632.1 hypothetical protein M1R55_07040 [Deinococcus sp. QL22]